MAEQPHGADPLDETIGSDDPAVTDPTLDAGEATPAAAAALASAEPPTVLGRHRLVRKLGEGGMGIVHLAHDEQLDRPVAIKLLQPEGDSRRLLREARSMARLSHPHIAAVYDVGTTDDGQVYVAMEYVEGPTLRTWLKASHPWAERYEVLLQAARGLAAAHAAGVVHRDFKPDNVIVGDDGRVRVLDFGLAKLAPRTMSTNASTTETQAGSIVGTPRYMAPEQLRTQPAGPAADQFALCVTAYEMAYDDRPFLGEVFADLVVSVLTQPPREPKGTPEVPDALWPVLLRGFAVDPEQRHSDMQALVSALEAVAGAPESNGSVTSRPALRDAREDARNRLTTAFAEDLIDADEIDERLERLENAQDRGSVEALVLDLVPAGEALVPLAGTEPSDALAFRKAVEPAIREEEQALALAVPETGRIVAAFSGSRRGGNWVPARLNKVIAVCGAATLDLREAKLPPGEIEIRVRVVFGGLEIIAPPGVEVRLECTSLFAGAGQEDPTEPPDPNATIVRVTGVVMFGGLTVEERFPGERASAARKRRRAHRRALTKAAKAKAKALGPAKHDSDDSHRQRRKRDDSDDSHRQRRKRHDSDDSHRKRKKKRR
ncbi:MAG: protein kinase [Myxococcota bacterium]